MSGDLKYGYTDSWSDYHDYLQVDDNMIESKKLDKKKLCQTYETYKTEECKVDGYGIPSTNITLKTQTQNNIKG